MDVSKVLAWLNTLPTPLFSPSVTLKTSDLHGNGLHAARNISPGEILVFDQGITVNEKIIEILVQITGHENALRLNWDTYALDAPLHGGAYINHSCSPNVGFGDDRALIAIKEVQEGEELFLDYGMSETARGWEMPCECGSTDCRKKITGEDHKNPNFREKYGKWFSPYLKKYWGIDEPSSLWNTNEESTTEKLTSWLSTLPTPLFHPKTKLLASPIHGQGLHTTAPLQKGEIVIVDRGVQSPNCLVELATTELDHQNDLAYDWEWSFLDSSVNGGAYANHSCEPNMGLANERTFVTLRDIEEGEELVVDYATFATDPEWNIECKCGSKTCRKTVSGNDHRNESFRQQRSEHLSPFLKDFWQREQGS